MSQNNFMYEWKAAKEHYDTLEDGSIRIHEDAPQRVKDSFNEHEKLMGKVKAFPNRKSSKSLFSFMSKSPVEHTADETAKKVRKENEKQNNYLSLQKVKNVKAIFDNNIKKEITKEILDALPDWFGIESSKQEYIEESAAMPYWAYYEEGRAVGFIAIKKNHKESAEIYVMGVLNQYQHQHIGSALLIESESWCRSDGIKYLQVKTVSEDSDDPYYAKTRAFYNASGFTPLDVLPNLWDAHNPCLIMIKTL